MTVLAGLFFMLCVCGCVIIAKWLEHWPGNQGVPGSMPGMPLAIVLVSLSKKLYSPTQLSKWRSGDLYLVFQW